MAVIKDSSYLYQTRLRRSAQSSPLPPNSQQKPRLRVNERRFTCKEVSRLKSPNIHSMKTENSYLINDKPTTPKKLPRYMLLPAIGKRLENQVPFSDPSQLVQPPRPTSVVSPARKVHQTPIGNSNTRQLTYTVLNPKYVKGPRDQPTKPGIIMPLLKSNSPKQTTKTKKVIAKNKCQDKPEILDGGKWRTLKPFSKTLHGPRILVSTELLNTFERLETGNLQHRNGAFWIQF